jgi:3-deoxy-D-manno-octulosonic-acid transferase
MSVFAEPFLFAYRSATIALGPVAPALLAWRRRRGKEDGQRVGERLGRAGKPRPDGRLAWLHGASVGEGLALLPLVQRLIDRGFHVLVTTGTVSSAKIMAARLPAGATHQYAPIDVPAFIRRFMDHWKPDLVVIAESELWPNMLCETRRRSIPLVLVNARLSRRSFRRWRALPRMIGPLLARIDLILAQTKEDGVRLARLGAPRVQVAGNLKYDVPPPPINPANLAELTAAIGSRPTWLAASTHAAEDEIVIDAHIQLARERPRILTIVAPRHVARGVEIAALAGTKGVRTALRSRGEPIGANTALYIADTMGELGLFYRLASVVFVGKSLGGAIGGQNPIEPAKLGAAVLHGPDVANFGEVYEAIDRAKGAEMVGDAATLSRTLGVLLSDPAATRRMARAAGEAVEKLGGATNAVMMALEPFIMQLQLERR